MSLGNIISELCFNLYLRERPWGIYFLMSDSDESSDQPSLRTTSLLYPLP